MLVSRICHLFKTLCDKIDKNYEKLPYFQLDYFKSGIKCTAHHESTIEVTDLPLKIEFEADAHICMNAYMCDTFGKVVNNTVLVQRDPESNIITAEISLSNNQVVVSLFAAKRKLLNKDSKLFDKEINFFWVSDFVLVPSESLQTKQKQIKFCEMNTFQKDIFLYEPKEKCLKYNKEYTFKVSLDSTDVWLEDSKQKIIKMNKDGVNKWTVAYKPTTKG